VNVDNLSNDDVQFLLERKFDYDRDERKTPDGARATRFKTGWRDAVASLSGERPLYTDLRTLTWQNLGYRLGRVFGDVPDEVKDTAFNLFSEHYRLQTYASLWRDDVVQWVTDKRLDVTPDVCINFFARVFANTRHPDKAWFGVHQSALSLVVGNVYLAAIDVAEGIWLLQMPDNEVDALPRATYKPIKSMPEHAPLVWLRLTDIRDMIDLLEQDDVWTAYAQASALLLQSSQATDRDATHVSKGKHRLRDFWDEA
jgi:putative restriction endonuclease